MDEFDLMSASYSPGFSHDLTSWRVCIARNRWLRQKVSVYLDESPYHKQSLCFWAKLSRQEVANLWGIVERIGFQSFRHRYTHETMCVTDRPSYHISVRFRDRLKEVEAYDMIGLAEYEKQPAVIGFRELWDAITARAPYEKVPIEEGLPWPWWRLW